jgi:hypothetical protein
MPGGVVLFTQAELRDDGLVFGSIGSDQVFEQVVSSADHFQKATTAAVVELVCFEVAGEFDDSSGKQCDLHFGAAGVAFGSGEITDDGRFLFSGDGHETLSVMAKIAGRPERRKRHTPPPQTGSGLVWTSYYDENGMGCKGAES